MKKDVEEIEDVEVVEKSVILAESAEIGSFMANRLGMNPDDCVLMIDPHAIACDGIPDVDVIYAVFSRPNNVVSDKVMLMLHNLEQYGYNLANIRYL